MRSEEEIRTELLRCQDLLQQRTHDNPDILANDSPARQLAKYIEGLKFCLGDIE